MLPKALPFFSLLIPSFVIGQTTCDSIPLTADFVASSLGNTVMFSDESLTGGYMAQYAWYFGDGGTSSVPDPIHTYALPGDYLVCLYVEIGPNNGADSCFAAFCDTISVGYPSPCDDLDPGFSVLTQGQVALFNNYVDDPSWGYLWTFGDGSMDWLPDPVHTYTQPGSYQACLTVWAWDGNLQDTCFADTCHLVLITGGGNPCDSLQACFAPDYQGANAFTFFNCSITPDPGQTTYYWLFGDGATSTDPSPTHAFPAGVWTVCLWATWENCADSTCQVITVGGAGCDSTFTAGFSWVDQGGGGVLFDGYSSLPATWSWWEFGDGTSGFGDPEQHFYSRVGQYQVCYTAGYWDPFAQDTCLATSCLWITVGGSSCDSLVQAAFTWTSQGNVVFFENLSNTSGYPTTFYWDLGDGSWTDAIDPVHTYLDTAAQQICLWASIWTGMDSCLSVTCDTVLPGSNGPQGIVSALATRLWQVGPVPATDHVRLNIPEVTGAIAFRLRSIEGRIVRRGEVFAGPTMEVDLEGLTCGTYVLEVTSGDQCRAFRVVKTR